MAVPAAESDPAADSGTARLQRSLAALQQALAEQGAVVARWRRSLDDLHANVRELHGSVHGYRVALDGLTAAAIAPASR